MPRASLSAPKIREELAWVAQGTGPESVWLPRYAMRTRPRAFRRRVHRAAHEKALDVPLGVFLFPSVVSISGTEVGWLAL